MPELTEQIAASVLMRHGEDGVWLQVIEISAQVMAARERMVHLSDTDADLIEGLARFELMLDVALLTGVGSISQCLKPDPDAWSCPGLMLARLIVTASWWLRRRRTADELASAMNDARSAMERIARPLRGSVDRVKARLVSEIC
jgi:hypothetical protein